MATAYKVEETDPGAHEQKLLEASRSIINRLSRSADEQVRAKAMIELRWLDDLTLYWGRYDSTTEQQLRDEGRSQSFINYTRIKTSWWSARFGDLMFPVDLKNWGIKPTPVPTLVQQAKEAVKRIEAAVEAANESTDPEQQARIKEMADSFAQQARKTHGEIAEANKRCEAMERTIDDQLTEADYVTKSRDVIEDMCRLGTGILKGPMTSQRLRAQWRETDGSWGLSQLPDPLPDFSRVDPWHFFPDMSAARIAEAEFTFERHLPTRKDLRRLARMLGFNPAAVKRLIDEGPRPVGLEVDHLTMLRAITNEGDALIDRYVMWEYHGSLECDEVCDLLRAAGQDEKARRFEEEKNPLDDYRVIIHFCNDEVLKIAPEYPLDSGETMYSVVTFAQGETSMFGIGLPNIIADPQRALCAAWRMILDNAALSACPQVVINRSAITPQDGSYTLRPFKSWLLSSTAGVSPSVPPFQVHPIEINQQQLAAIIEMARAFIDEMSGLPMVAQGEAGTQVQPVGTTSILTNSANVLLRRLAKIWDDDLTKPTIRRAYDWNMQFNPDESIKGDMQVDAKGSSVLLVRELQSQTLMNMMTNWTTHPVIGPWIVARADGGRRPLEMTAQTLMIAPDDIFATKDEYDAYMRKQTEAQGDEATDPNAIRLQIAQAQIASNEKLATLEYGTREKIAQMQMDMAVAKLAAETGQSEQEIRTKYGIEEMKVGSTERLEAARIAVEDRRAREATAAGESASEAVGKEIG